MPLVTVCVVTMLAIGGWFLAGWGVPTDEQSATAAARELRECVDRLTTLMGAGTGAEPDEDSALGRQQRQAVDDCRDKRVRYKTATGASASIRPE